MKKWGCFLLIINVLYLLSACGAEPIKDPGNFYYRQGEIGYGTADGVIQAEIRELDGIHNDIGTLLTMYFQGPEDKNLEAPFPRNTSIIKWALVDNTLLLTLSPEFSQLSGIDMTIACGCITKTITELTSVQRINFQVENALLNGERSITMSKTNLQLSDDSLDRLVTDVTIYYADAQRRYLIGKEMTINLAEEANIAEYLIHQLCAPPNDSNLLSPLPEQTALLDVTINNKICRVNFSSSFDQRAWRSSEAQRLSLLSVVNTLTQLPQIDHVEFYCEGNLITQYRLLSIPGPMSQDERAIGPVRNGLNEFDASLYLTNCCNEYLVCIPTRIRQASGTSKAEMVVRELAAYKSRNGFSSPLPPDTEINSVSVNGSTCYIDLGSSFLNAPELVPQAVRCIIASVCALPEIENSIITVDGAIPSGELSAYFQFTTVASDWIF